MLHEDENEDEEISPEMKERRKRLKAKMNEVMSEMVDISMDDETKQKVEEQLRNLFKEHELSFSHVQMNAFLHGMEFACAAYSNDQKMTMMVICVLRNMVEKGKEKIRNAMPKI